MSPNGGEVRLGDGDPIAMVGSRNGKVELSITRPVLSAAEAEALALAIAYHARVAEAQGAKEDRPVWELQPSDPSMAQCEECFALVLRAAMKAHEHWHDQLKGRA